MTVAEKILEKHLNAEDYHFHLWAKGSGEGKSVAILSAMKEIVEMAYDDIHSNNDNYDPNNSPAKQEFLNSLFYKPKPGDSERH